MVVILFLGLLYVSKCVKCVTHCGEYNKKWKNSPRNNFFPFSISPLGFIIDPCQSNITF